MRLIKSPNGHVRGAELSSSKGGTLRRPLNMIYPLEISSNDITEPESDSTIEPDLVSTIDPDTDETRTPNPELNAKQLKLDRLSDVSM